MKPEFELQLDSPILLAGGACASCRTLRPRNPISVLSANHSRGRLLESALRVTVSKAKFFSNTTEWRVAALRVTAVNGGCAHQCGDRHQQITTNSIPGSCLPNPKNPIHRTMAGRSERRRIFSSVKNRNRILAGARGDPQSVLT